jgi:hypothetical protein
LDRSKYLFSATPILGFKIAVFEPIFMFCTRNVPLLIPFQFQLAENQEDSMKILAGIAINVHKNAVFCNPFKRVAENK